MDTDTKTASQLPAVRTLAKDLARKGGNARPTDTPQQPKAAAQPKPKDAEAAFADSTKNPVYRAPTWKKGTPPLPTPKNSSHSEESPTTEDPKIKPLSRPKAESDPTIIVTNEDAATATIIRDTKRNRFRLFPAIADSLRRWWHEQKQKRQAKKTPTYTVPETTRRKGVIQQATSKTGKVATFDNSTLTEKIRERRERAIPKPKKAEPVTIWTANTEPGYLLLESPETPVGGVEKVTVETRKSFRTRPTPPTPVPPAPRPTPPTPAAPVLPKTPLPPTPPTPLIAPEPLREPSPEPLEPLPTVTVAEEESSPVVAPTPPITVLTPTSFKEWLFTINTNLMALGVAAGVFIIAVVSIVGYTLIKNSTDSLEITRPLGLSVLLPAPLQTLTPTSLRQSDIVSLISDNQKQSGFPVQQFALTTSPSGESALPPATILAALNITINQAFLRSITALHFGSLKSTKPFWALKVTDAATARGGMLAWEATLYRDLLPFLLAHNIVTSDTTLKDSFTDEIVAGKDARLLENAAGVTVVAYAINDDNVLIIATDEDSLTTLLTLTN